MRRWLRRLGVALLVALGTIFLLVSGAWLYLSTGPGEAWLVRELEARIDAAIAGSVRFGSIDLLASTVTLHDVRLLDPDGKVVARVEQAQVTVAPLALIDRTIAIEGATVIRPELSIVRDDGGTNLERALAPTHKRPEQPRAPGEPPFNVRIHDVAVKGAALSLRTEGSERALEIAGLDLAGRFEEGKHFIDAALRGEGRVEAPAKGPLTLQLGAHRDDGTWSANVRLQAAGAQLVAEGASEGSHTRVQVHELVLPPDVTQAVIARWPLVTALRGQARLLRDGHDLEVDATLEAATARAALEGHFNLETWTSRGVRLEVSDVNLAELVREGPRSDIDLEARAQGGGRSLETLDGEVQVNAPSSPVMGSQFGPVRIDARAHGGAISLRSMKVTVPGLSLTATGKATPQSVDVKGTATARNLGLFARTLGRLAGPKGLPLDGHGRASFHLRGRTRNPTLTVEARFPVLKWEQQVSRGVNIDLEIPDVGIRLRQLRERGEDVEPSAAKTGPRIVPAIARGTPNIVPAQDEATRPPRPIELRVQVEDLGLEDLLKRLGLEITLAGVTEAKVELSGSPEDPGLDLRVRLNQVVAEGLPPLDVTVTARSKPGGPITLGFSTAASDQPSRLTVRLPWSLGTLFQRRLGPEDLLDAAYVVKGDIRRFPVPPALLGLEHPPMLSATLNLQGSPRRPRGSAKLGLTGIGGGALPPVSVTADVALQGAATRVEVSATQEERLLARVDARIAASPLRFRTVQEDPDIPVEAELILGAVPLSDLTTFASWFLPEAPQRLPAEGLLSGRVHFEGSLARPVASAEVALIGLTAWENASPGDLFVRAAYGGERLALTASLVGPTGGTMEVAASAPVELSFQRLRAGIDVQAVPVEGSVVATGIDPSFLSGLSRQVLKLGGRIHADATIAGSLGEPDLRGEVRWEDGQLELAGFGSYREIQLLARGDRNRVVIEKLTAASAAGSAELSGSLLRDGGEGYALDARIRLERFPVVNRDQHVANLSVEATAKGLASLDNVVISPLEVSRARIELPTLVQKEVQALEPPQNVTFVRNGKPIALPEETAATPEERRRKERRVTLEAQIDAPRNVLLIGPDFNVELGLGEDFRVVVEQQPVISGTVKIIRGVLEVFGREFELQEDSIVTFSGPPQRPQLDVTAQHVNAREDVTITLSIRGIPPELEITPTSNPPLTETEIYTLLATGRRAAQTHEASGRGLSASAVSLLGGVITGRLEQGISELVPVDYLRIQPGAEGFTGTRIETGRQLTNRLFLGLETQIGADVPFGHNRSQLQLDYQIGRQIVLELIYGDARVGTLDLLWKRRY